MRLSLTTIIVVSSISIVLSIFFLEYFTPGQNPNQNEPISTTTSGGNLDLVFMKSKVLPGHYLTIYASFNDPKNNTIIVANPNNLNFNNCTVIYNTANGNLTLGNYSIMQSNSYHYFMLNKTFDKNERVIFECKDPHDMIMWPHLHLNSMVYSPGDNVRLDGILGVQQDVTILVINPNQTTNGIYAYPNTYFIQKNIKTDLDGSISFSFMIPNDAKQGMWSIGTRVNSDPNFDSLQFEVK